MKSPKPPRPAKPSKSPAALAGDSSSDRLATPIPLVGPPRPSLQKFGQAIVDNLNRQTAPQKPPEKRSPRSFTRLSPETERDKQFLDALNRGVKEQVETP